MFYLVAIVGGLLSRVWFSSDGTIRLGRRLFRRSVVFAVAMSVVRPSVVEMGGLLGFGTLKNLLTGRYVQPKREQKAFLLIDMKDSTGLAERLGRSASTSC